jgi:hypothetical protein
MSNLLCVSKWSPPLIFIDLSKAVSPVKLVDACTTTIGEQPKATTWKVEARGPTSGSAEPGQPPLDTDLYREADKWALM